MKSYALIVAKLFGCGVAAAFVLVSVLALVIDFRIGSASPGVWAVAKAGLHDWIPIVLVLVALWFVVSCCRIAVMAHRRAAEAGMNLWEFFDLTPEQRAQLAKERKKMT